MTNRPTSESNKTRAARPIAARLLAGVLLTGCQLDSYLDPSVVGRWERTPTVVPILERLAIIEGPEDEFVEYTDVLAEDLIPVPDEYRTSPGDTVRVTAYDLVTRGVPDIYERTIDNRGMVQLPQLGQVYIAGMTSDEARQAIAQSMTRFVANPLVTVEIPAPRKRTFTIFGAVSNPGPYFVPSADYRLLEALNTAGSFGQSVEYIYVIRQKPLTDEVRGVPAPPPTGTMPGQAQPMGVPNEAPPADELLDLIDELSGPDDAAGSPAVRRSGARAALRNRVQQDAPEPMIDLVESDVNQTFVTPAQGVATPMPSNPAASNGTTTGRWVFRNGRWMQTDAGTRAGTGNGGNADPLGGLVTQRVIRVPVDPLVAGDARFNIVVKPGDIIRVPAAEGGNIYIAGQVARPGVYQLPAQGRLTLVRAIDAAGGLGNIAIPERVDLTRMVGPDRQATIQLNLKAIAEGTQPDVFLKPDDRINIGTNFWALPLAVVRNGFRFTYGFGFLLDRNFGNDVFGPPPTDDN